MNHQINSSAKPDQFRTVEPADRDDLISRRLTFLMHRVMTVTNGAGQPCFREWGVSIPEARALIGLIEVGDLKVGDLANLISADVSTLSHLLRRLERSGWVLRARDEADSRAVRISLTDSGRELARMCRDASLSHEKILMKGLSQSQVRRLKDTLEQVYRNAVEGFGGEGLPR